MSGQVRFTMHYLNGVLAKANDTRLPLWYRVALLAETRLKANGHASFERGELGKLLHVSDRSNVRRAISDAIKYDHLSDRSNTRCLVMPAHQIEMKFGAEWEPCERHGDVVVDRPHAPVVVVAEGPRRGRSATTPTRLTSDDAGTLSDISHGSKARVKRMRKVKGA